MSYQVLARKWRPSTFDQMVGQDHVLKALVNALNGGRLHHAYLFTGTRGVGKTSIARLFAKSLNCENGVSASPCGECSPCRDIKEGRFVDLIEVDAASRTKVEDTRELLENVQYAPTQGRFKVYLIDEVHMLSTHSFNALLKTLEEPPPHIKFLLATTDPQKLPVTILSRCLQFNLKNMSPERIVDHLKHILAAEQIAFEDPALWLLSRAANGSMRDALSLTDQAISFGSGQLLEDDVRAMLGSVDQQQVLKLLAVLAEGSAVKVMDAVASMAEFGADFSDVLAELLGLLHRVTLAQVLPESIDNSLGDKEAVLSLARSIRAEDIQLFYQIALCGRKDLPLVPVPRDGFEMTLLRMLAFRPISAGEVALPKLDGVDSTAALASSEEGALEPHTASEYSAPEESIPEERRLEESTLEESPLEEKNADAVNAPDKVKAQGMVTPQSGFVDPRKKPQDASLEISRDSQEITRISQDSQDAPSPEPTMVRSEISNAPPHASVLSESPVPGVSSDKTSFAPEGIKPAVEGHMAGEQATAEGSLRSGASPEWDEAPPWGDSAESLAPAQNQSSTQGYGEPQTGQSNSLQSESVLPTHEPYVNPVSEFSQPPRDDTDPPNPNAAFNSQRDASPSVASRQPTASPPTKKADIPEEFVAETSGGAKQEAINIRLSELNAENWIRLLSVIGLSGMTYNIAANAAIEGIEALTADGSIDNEGVVRFLLPGRQMHLYNDTHQQRIEASLSDYFGGNVRVVFNEGDSASETPAQYKERRRKECLADAIAAIQGDPNVQAMIDRFGATVDVSSVEPVSS